MGCQEVASIPFSSFSILACTRPLHGSSSLPLRTFVDLFLSPWERYKLVKEHLVLVFHSFFATNCQFLLLAAAWCLGQCTWDFWLFFIIIKLGNWSTIYGTASRWIPSRRLKQLWYLLTPGHLFRLGDLHHGDLLLSWIWFCWFPRSTFSWWGFAEVF